MPLEPGDPAVYRALGLPDPEGWASVAREYGGTAQPVRATLLRAFADIAAATAANPRASLADSTGSAVEAVSRRFQEALGENDRRIIAGAVAWSVLQDVCALLSGATEPEVNPADVSFGVYSEGEDGTPGERLEVLHEEWRAIGAAYLGEEVVRS